MSTFNGIVAEFPYIRIDRFTQIEGHPPPLACFLSHVHSDHLTGLLSYLSPFIYCTAATKQMLLRLEKWPHRMNFARGILESRKQTYKKLKKVLRIIPLNTPTQIEISPGYNIQVTLFDANHCTGAVMFLIEGQGKAILYTGDVRSEPWWVDNLVRNPIILPYTAGVKRLDNIYLDTTFATKDDPHRYFPPKADGLAEMLQKVSEYPADTIFYFNAWTFGYEECWMALSNLLRSKIHLDDYRYGIYSHIGEEPDCNRLETAPLLGFRLGHLDHPGCLTNDPGVDVRIHSCERGTQCEIHNRRDVVTILPIITRHRGIEYGERGAGGGRGDLDQVHELELRDIETIGKLLELCDHKLKDRPDLMDKVKHWIENGLNRGASSLRLNTTAFLNVVAEVHANRDLQQKQTEAIPNDDDVPLDRFVAALEAMLAENESEQEAAKMAQTPSAKVITFPYSRHSSYGELRHLVAALRPKSLFPNTVMPGLDMDDLFGDLLRDCSPTKGQCIDAGTQTSPSRATHSDPVIPATFNPAPHQQLVTTSPPDIDVDDAMGFLREANDAALGRRGKIWGVDVELTCVNGYHNAEREREL